MAVLYKALRDLALIDLHFLLQEIHGELLLQPCIAFVFFVGQDTLNCPAAPFGFLGRHRDAFGGELLSDGRGGFGAQKKIVNVADCFGLLRRDLRELVRAFLVTEALYHGIMAIEIKTMALTYSTRKKRPKAQIERFTLCENDLSQKRETKSIKNTKQPLRKALRGG